MGGLKPDMNRRDEEDAEREEKRDVGKRRVGVWGTVE